MSDSAEGQASRHKRHDRLTVGHGVYAAGYIAVLS